MSALSSEVRPLRILTLDNGGLQVLSVLLILRTACQSISQSDEWKAPCELFDVIAGVGTGGWLALLLGRYRLTLQQCASIYIRIALAVAPRLNRSRREKRSRNPAAISQQKLIEEFASLIEDRELSEFLLDNEVDSSQQSGKGRSCYGFAIGVTKERQYRLFRGYSPPTTVDPSDPDPRKCRFTSACAATAAAKDFMQEYELGGEVYWDGKFPCTHNITKLALDEATALFGKRKPLSVVLNISPGTPNARQVQTLRKAAYTNATTSSRIRYGLHRIWDSVSPSSIIRHRSDDLPERSTDQNGKASVLQSPRSSDRILHTKKKRTDTASSASSVSSQVIEQELLFEEQIISHLNNVYGTSSMYHRMAYTPDQKQAEKPRPYLNDVRKTNQAEGITQEFLDSDDATKKIRSFIQSWSDLHYRLDVQT